jgi:hypothetical protein
MLPAVLMAGLLLSACKKSDSPTPSVTLGGYVINDSNRRVPNVMLYIDRGVSQGNAVVYSGHEDSVTTTAMGSYRYIVKNGIPEGSAYRICCKVPVPYRAADDSCKTVRTTVIDGLAVADSVNFILKY